MWPEAGQRQRVWVPLEEAAVRARDDWMRQALEAYVRRHSWEGLAGADAASMARTPEPAPLPQQQQQEHEAAGPPVPTPAQRPLPAEQHGNGVSPSPPSPAVPS